MTRPIRMAACVLSAKTPSYAMWRDAVLRAEDAGADIIFGDDHFVVPAIAGRDANGRPIAEDNPPVLPRFEGWTALASWAEITSRAEIGLLVGGVGFRNPDLVADMARTVDHISGGRVILGLGTGWYEPDYTEYGYEFGTAFSRRQTLRDALERIEHRLTALEPPPLHKIPILIGAAFEKSLPVVARYADIWHTEADLPTFARRNDSLSGHAESVGRHPAEIERSAKWPGTDAAGGFADAGVTMFTVEVLADRGYDLSELKAALAWRDSRL